MRQGDEREARRLFGETLPLFREMNEPFGIATMLQFIGAVALDEGDLKTARSCFAEALPLFRELGNHDLTASMLDWLGKVADQEGNSRRALRVVSAGQAYREATGVAPAPGVHARRDELVALLRNKLSEEAFAAAWAEGQAMTLAQAISDAVEDSSGAPEEAG
jgi:hypothetical protein